MRFPRVLVVPTLVFLAAFALAACNGAKGPSNPLTGPSITMEASADVGTDADGNSAVGIKSESGGVTVTPFYDTFGNPCTPKAPGSVLQRNVTAKNHSGHTVHSHPVLSHRNTLAGCAVDESQFTPIPPGQVPQYLQVSVTSLANNQTSQVHFTFTLPPNACGTYLVKDFWDPNHKAKLLNKTVDTGIVCGPPPPPFCDTVALNMDLHAAGALGHWQFVTPTFNGDSTVSVDWCDGEQCDNKHSYGLPKGVESPKHVFPNQDHTYHVTAKVVVNGHTCTDKADAEVLYGY